MEEAIRPHVTGRFEDMLFAVMHHPAMLLYLNNAGSVGPDSPRAQGGKRGLNENLARECLELHTVSPAAGYTQADVTNFAKILTGWSIDLRDDPPGFPLPPARRTSRCAGRDGPQRSRTARRAASRRCTSWPTIPRRIASWPTKLVRHFVADDPPPDAVRRIEGVLRDTGGDLGAAAAALITLDAAWQPASQAADAAGLRDRRICARSICRTEQRQTVQPPGHPGRPGPAVLERAAAERLARPRRRLGRARGDDAADRLGVWRVWPRRHARRGGTGRCHPRAAAAGDTLAGGAPRRLAPRRHDVAADRSGIPEAMIVAAVPPLPPCLA